MNTALSTTSAAVVALSAATVPSLPALADFVETQNRWVAGAPNASFPGVRVMYGSGDLSRGANGVGDDTLGMFQQTITSSMSGQAAIFRLQSSLFYNNAFVRPEDLRENGRAYHRQWTLNVFMFDADSFDPTNPNASLLSQQSVNNTTLNPSREGTASGEFIYGLTYDLTMPVLAPDTDSKRLFLAFAPNLNYDNGDTVRFRAAVSSRDPNSAGFAAEGPTDWMYINTTETPYTFPVALPGRDSGRLALSLAINTIPAPAPIALGLGALAIAAGSRRRSV